MEAGTPQLVKLEELRVRVLPPVQGQSDLPRPREDFRILDRGLVVEDIRTDRGISLHHVERLAVEVARPVEPCLIVETGRGNHQRIPLELADRLPHP